MLNFCPTDEQRSILTANDRLIVVRACPGSGKTSVFAEKVRQFSNSWPYCRKGIAALSFTNAASEEIFNRVGGSLPPPHFIGTLDSFVLRNIVLPFGHLVGLPKEGARLVPSPLDERLKFSPFKYGATDRETVPICSVRITGGSIQAPMLEFYDPVKKKRVPVEAGFVEKAILLKQKNWKSNGIITHSDSHYIAAELLTAHKQRDLLVQTIAKRFPVVLVDEFQDTMSFLSQALISLLSSSLISGMVVGDPDQSIYEFGGAQTNLFEDVESLSGAQLYPITISQRFGVKIAAVVSSLSHSETKIESALTKSTGSAILVVHDKSEKDLTPVFARNLIARLGLTGEIVLLGRKGKVCKKLQSLTNMDAFPGESKLAKQIDLAVFLFRRGENTKASTIIARELWNLLTDHESMPTKHDLHDRGIDMRQWRRHLFRILVEADRYIANEIWKDWLKRVKECVEETLLSLKVTKKLGGSFRSDAKSAVARSMPSTNRQVVEPEYRVLTVHQAKGAEFESVLLILGKPHARLNPCISTQWWGDTSIEEKRVGFVALSRAREKTVLCVHKETYKSLLDTQKDFVGLFCEVVVFREDVTE